VQHLPGVFDYSAMVWERKRSRRFSPELIASQEIYGFPQLQFLLCD
jgi:hypothetical protein